MRRITTNICVLFTMCQELYENSSQDLYPGPTEASPLNSTNAESNEDVRHAIDCGDGETAVEQSGQVAIEESKGVRFSISSQKFGSETLEMGQ